MFPVPWIYCHNVQKVPQESIHQSFHLLSLQLFLWGSQGFVSFRSERIKLSFPFSSFTITRPDILLSIDYVCYLSINIIEMIAYQIALLSQRFSRLQICVFCGNKVVSWLERKRMIHFFLERILIAVIFIHQKSSLKVAFFSYFSLKLWTYSTMQDRMSPFTWNFPPFVSLSTIKPSPLSQLAGQDRG